MHANMAFVLFLIFPVIRSAVKPFDLRFTSANIITYLSSPMNCYPCHDGVSRLSLCEGEIGDRNGSGRRFAGDISMLFS